MQDFWSYDQPTSMDTGARETPAAAAAMSRHMHPRDETVTDREETDPFAGSEDEASSAEFTDNPGKAMATHVISEEVMDNTEEVSCDVSGDMVVDGEGTVDTAETGDTGEPASASTPNRRIQEEFRIVTIEHPSEKNSGNVPMAAQTASTADVNSGDDRSADAATADSCVIQPPLSGTESEVNSATGKKGDAHSAKQTPDKNGARIQSDAGSAPKNSAGKSDGARTAKVPSMCPPPAKPAEKVKEEADAVPSSTYKAILEAKKNKLTPPAMPGIGPATAKLDCGSFYNSGDNRIRRTVYKENVASLIVTSLSFNPVTWECASCPSKHQTFGGGG